MSFQVCLGLPARIASAPRPARFDPHRTSTLRARAPGARRAVAVVLRRVADQAHVVRRGRERRPRRRRRAVGRGAAGPRARCRHAHLVVRLAALRRRRERAAALDRAAAPADAARLRAARAHRARRVWRGAETNAQHPAARQNAARGRGSATRAREERSARARRLRLLSSPRARARDEHDVRGVDDDARLPLSLSLSLARGARRNR